MTLSTDGSTTDVHDAWGGEQPTRSYVSGVSEWRQRFNSNQLTGEIRTMALNKAMAIGHLGQKHCATSRQSFMLRGYRVGHKEKSR